MKKTSIWILCLSLLCLTVPCRADGETKPYDFGPPAKKRGISPSSIRRLPSGLNEHGADFHNQILQTIANSDDTLAVSSGPFFSIPIQEGESPSGAKTYSIPITTAVGVKGAPAISLSYNSQSGNGDAGFGWNITGLSSINISNKNRYYNGVVAPANVTDTTAFFTLDGEAIVPNADVSLFPGYVYETSKSHIKIRKHVNGSIITHFTALYPDGSHAVFGDSLATEARSCFPIAKTVNNDGYVTTYTYTYPSAGDYHYISEIRYGSLSGSDSPAGLSFVWIPTNNSMVQYCAGNRFDASHILKIIVSTDGETSLMSYFLIHDYSGDYPFLARLDCARANEYANPLCFSYGGDDEPYWPFPSDSDWLSEEAEVSANFNVNDDDFFFIRGKYVRNTFSDGVAVFPARPFFKQRYSIGKAVYYGSGYGEESIMVLPSVSDEPDAIALNAGAHVVSIAAVDIDGDSADEIVRIREVDENALSTTKHYSVKTNKYSPENGNFTENYFNPDLNGYFSTGSYFTHYYSANQRNFLYGDFKGDGTMQVAAVSYSQNAAGYSQTPYVAVIDLGTLTKLSDEVLFTGDYPYSESACVFALDIDSDGRTELCRATTAGLKLYHLTSAGTFALSRTVSGITSTVINAPGRQPCFTDLNADGYVDIAMSPVDGSSAWDIYNYTGLSFIHTSVSHITRVGGDDYVFLDLTGDGLPECNIKRGNDVYSYKNISGNLSTVGFDVLHLDSSGNETVPVNVLSYNAASSFFTVEGSNIKTYSLFKNWQKARALTRVKDSFGNITLNSYAMMGDTDVYRADETIPCNNAAGYADIAAPLLLLRSSDSYASGSKMMLSSKYYDYHNAVAHQFGLGFCGFRKIRCTDYLSPGNHGRGVEGDRPVVTVQSFDPQKMGVPLRQVSTLGPDGSTLSDIEYTWDNCSTAYGKLNPRLTATTQTDSLAGLITETVYTYGAHDLPVLIKTVRTNELGDVKKDSVLVTYDNRYGSSQYIIGLVTSQKNVRNKEEKFNQDYWEKKQTADYDSSGRLVCKKDYAWFHKKVYLNPDLIPGPVIPPFLPLDAGGMSQTGDVPVSIFIYERQGGGIVTEERFHYDNFGNVDTLRIYSHEATTPLVSSYAYDQSGRQVLSSTDPIGLTTTYSGYNVFGKPGTVTDAQGRATITSFDNWGNPIRTDYADGTWETKTTAWDSLGLFRVNTLNSAGQQSVAHIDPAGRTIRSGSLHFDGRWIVSDKEFDGASGFATRESLPHPSDAPDSTILWNNISYDRFGRDSCMVAASGAVTSVTYNCSVTSITESNKTTTRTVDADGQVVLINDPSGDIVNVVRPDGQLDSVTVHNGVITTFAYDAFGARYKIVDPSLGTQTDTTYWRADGSSLTTTTNSYGTTNTTADRFGRVTQVQYGTGPLMARTTITSTYDPYGRLTSSVSNKGQALAYTYDAYDRPVTIVETGSDSYTFTKSYTYNANGTTASVAYSSSLAGGLLATENYSYANGILYQTALSDGTIVSRIDAENNLGMVSTATTPHGVHRHYSYTPAGIPTTRNIGAATESYSWFAATGDLSSRALNPGTSPLQPQYDAEQFLYDTKGRLMNYGRIRRSSNVFNITYDSRDNITSIDGAATMQYANSDKPYTLSSYSAENSLDQRALSISYNESGRPSDISFSLKNLSASIDYGTSDYRCKMTLTEVTSIFPPFLAPGEVQAPASKPLGEGPQGIIPSPIGTVLLTRYYFGGGKLDADVLPSGAKTVRLYLGGNPYSAPAVLVKDSLNNITVYNIWRDHLGSVRAIGTDSTSVSYFSYDAWGRPRNPESLSPLAYESATNILNRGFTGHEYLPWFGVYNANARLYDPLLGRFLSPDPYVQNPACSQNYNRFAYCLNNPLNYRDESGEFWLTFGIVVGICAITFGSGNAAVHCIRGDRGWFNYFWQGALAGAIVGATVTCAFYGGFALGGALAAKGGAAAIIGNTLTGITTAAMYSSISLGATDALSAVVGFIGGAIQSGWNGIGRQAKILLGRYYMDENDFFGGILQGVSRFTWERYQTSLGYEYSSIRNAFGSSANRVDFLGGVTFVTNENSKNNQGITIGNYCNMDIKDEISGSFDEYVTSHPLYMHEYGHTIDSRSKGITYLFGVGIPSIISAANATDWDDYTTTHDYEEYETRANMNAASYFKRHYGVNWRTAKYYKDTRVTIERAYPLPIIW